MANATAVATRAGFTSSWVRLLDDVFRIPGTNIRFGIDGFIGLLLPGVGDAVTGAGSAALLTMALRERVPTVVLVRMIANITVDVLLGMLPGFGDAFDFVWKSNRRNLTLIEQYGRKGKGQAGLLDYLLVGIGLFLAAVSVIMPLLILFVFGEAIRQGAMDWWATTGLELPW